MAPVGARVSGTFSNVDANPSRYQKLLADVQRFRGRTYIADGALRQSDVDSSGRHRYDGDLLSWHVVALNVHGEVSGCSRYRVHSRSADFSELAVSRAALAESEVWRPALIRSVEELRHLARRRGIDFVEVGGWAISEELRRTTESIRIALGTYALANHLGECIGITTATVRHRSAMVLRKIGGSSLASGDVEIPAYFDPQYNCEMQILKFESEAPNPKMTSWIEQLRHDLRTVEIITSDLPALKNAGQFVREWANPSVALPSISV
jgi:hypothetical protein